MTLKHRKDVRHDSHKSSRREHGQCSIHVFHTFGQVLKQLKSSHNKAASLLLCLVLLGSNTNMLLSAG